MDKSLCRHRPDRADGGLLADTNLAPAFFGMSTYSTLAMLYLGYVGLNGGGGILLWPAVAVHVGLSVVLVRARWMNGDWISSVES